MAGLGNFEAATAAKLRLRPLPKEEEEDDGNSLSFLFSRYSGIFRVG